jgi:predicted AAA+ superfamily ATPase
MKEIKRDFYLNQLIKKDGNGQIKIITGIRRCGKSYLLKNIFYKYLLKYNDRNHVIYIPLDIKENESLLDGNKFIEYIRTLIKDDKKYYLLIDEIQKMDDFVPVLNTFLYENNIEVYVTGSNAKLLSKDIVTEFRGRGDEIHIYPLSFIEYMSAFDGDQYECYEQFSLYGGLPYTLAYDTDNEKADYLKKLFQETYIRDIIERNNILNIEELNELLNIISSQIGSLTNPYNLQNTFKSKKNITLSDKTISKYLELFEDAFLISKAQRYDVKGKKYINTPYKYYFEDIGLRNARLNFRQIDKGHIMENIIYNELLRRKYNVDVGVVEINKTDENGVRIKPQYEVDFVCNQGSKRIYIQSAYEIKDVKKELQERKSLMNIDDSFKKIIILGDVSKPRMDENGIITMGIYHFLLNEDSLDRI